MASALANAPSYPEALPAYRPRGQADPDTFSIHSSAPSYVSEVPTYNSTERRQSLQSNPRSPRSRRTHNATTNQRTAPPQIGLPRVDFAPGFQNRAGTLGSRRGADLNIHNYAINHWSSVNSSHASRQYYNVATRRANAHSILSSAAMFSSMTSRAAPPTIAEESPSASSSNLAGPSSSRSPQNSSSNLLGHDPRDDLVQISPASPLEDPYLVGETAAARARKARIYREMCLRGEDALRHEGKAWDFMRTQMGDWEERGRRTKLLGQRLGRLRFGQ